MKLVIGLVLTFALVAPAEAQDWEGHISLSGAIVIQPSPPPPYPPYPFSYVQD